MAKHYNKVVVYDDTKIDLTSDTVDPSHVLEGETFHMKSGELVEGTMPNRATSNIEISSKDEVHLLESGYYDESASVGIAPKEAEKIVPKNIRQGVTILGVKGSAYLPMDAYEGPYTVTSSLQDQVLETKHKAMNDDVVVESIPVYRVTNESGGKTVTIGI